MTIKIKQLEDEQVALGFMAMNLIYAGFLGFTDEGNFSFGFLTHFDGLMFTLYLGLLFSVLPNALYFGLSLFKLNKGLRLIMSAMFQTFVLIYIFFVVF